MALLFLDCKHFFRFSKRTKPAFKDESRDGPGRKDGGFGQSCDETQKSAAADALTPRYPRVPRVRSCALVARVYALTRNGASRPRLPPPLFVLVRVHRIHKPTRSLDKLLPAGEIRARGRLSDDTESSGQRRVPQPSGEAVVSIFTRNGDAARVRLMYLCLHE